MVALHRASGIVPARTDIVIRLDDNPRYKGSVHDDEVARAMGFRAALVPGAFLYGHASRLAIDAWGLDWARHGWMTVRFRKPVYNGDAVWIAAAQPERRDGRTEIAITMHGAGQEVMTGYIGLSDRPPSAPDPMDWPIMPTPLDRPVVMPGGMRAGQLGTADPAVLSELDVAESRAAFDERHPFYSETGLVHSGCLMRRAMFEVNGGFRFPGPIVLTGCETQHFAPVRPGQHLATSSVVAAAYEKRERDYFETDELMLADGVPVARFRRTQIYASRR